MDRRYRESQNLHTTQQNGTSPTSPSFVESGGRIATHDVFSRREAPRKSVVPPASEISRRSSQSHPNALFSTTTGQDKNTSVQPSVQSPVHMNQHHSNGQASAENTFNQLLGKIFDIVVLQQSQIHDKRIREQLIGSLQATKTWAPASEQHHASQKLHDLARAGENEQRALQDARVELESLAQHFSQEIVAQAQATAPKAKFSDNELADIATLSRRFDQVEKQNNELRRSVEDLRKSVDTINAAPEDKAVSKLPRQCDDLTAQLESLELRYEDLQKDYQERDNVVRKRIEKAKDWIHDVDVDVKQLKYDLRDVRSRLEDSRTSKRQLVRNSPDMEENIRVLKEGLASNSTNLTKLENGHALLSQSVDGRLEALEERIKGPTSAELASSIHELGETQQELDSKGTQRNKIILEHVLEIERNMRSELKQRRSESKEASREEGQNHEERVARLERTVEELSIEVLQARPMLEHWSTAQKDLELRNKKIEERLSYSQKVVAGVSATASQLEKHLRECLSKSEATLSEAVSNMTQRNEGTEKRLAQLESSPVIVALPAKISQLEQQVATLRDDRASACRTAPSIIQAAVPSRRSPPLTQTLPHQHQASLAGGPNYVNGLVDLTEQQKAQLGALTMNVQSLEQRYQNLHTEDMVSRMTAQMVKIWPYAQTANEQMTMIKQALTNVNQKLERQGKQLDSALDKDQRQGQAIKTLEVKMDSLSAKQTAGELGAAQQSSIIESKLLEIGDFHRQADRRITLMEGSGAEEQERIQMVVDQSVEPLQRNLDEVSSLSREAKDQFAQISFEIEQMLHLNIDLQNNIHELRAKSGLPRTSFEGEHNHFSSD